jgi:hypothetical protein
MPAHKIVRANDFMGLAALSRKFLQASTHKAAVFLDWLRIAP